MRLLICMCVVAGASGLADAAAQDASTQDASAVETQAGRTEEEARALFIAGRAALEDGRYADALSHFQRSYDLSQRPQLLYNIAVAHDRLRHDDEAIAAFRAYLDAIPDASNRADVEARLEVLEREAAVAESIAPVAAPEPEPTVEATPLRKKWWLWALVGVAAVGIGVGVGVALARDDTPDPIPADAGVIATLRFGP